MKLFEHPDFELHRFFGQEMLFDHVDIRGPSQLTRDALKLQTAYLW